METFDELVHAISQAGQTGYVKKNRVLRFSAASAILERNRTNGGPNSQFKITGSQKETTPNKSTYYYNLR